MSELENSGPPGESEGSISELRQLIRQVDDSIYKGPDSIREHLRKIEEKLEGTATKTDLDSVELNLSKGAHRTLRRTIIFVVIGTIFIIALLIILLIVILLTNSEALSNL